MVPIALNIIILVMLHGTLNVFLLQLTQGNDNKGALR